MCLRAAIEIHLPIIGSKLPIKKRCVSNDQELQSEPKSVIKTKMRNYKYTYSIVCIYNDCSSLISEKDYLNS